MLTIVPFETKYTQIFKDLNIEWITEYFKVEEKDRELLENSQAAIIDKGGFIFIGLWHNEPVGCFALIRKNKDRYELGKMAVSKSYHGLQIGQNYYYTPLILQRIKTGIHLNYIQAPSLTPPCIFIKNTDLQKRRWKII